MDNEKKEKGKVSGFKPKEEEKSALIFVKYGLLAAAIIAVIVIGLLIYFSAAGSYVAIIDGKKIGVDEYRYYLEIQKQAMYGDARLVDPNISEETFWATKIDGEDAEEVAKRKALDLLKDTKVQYIRAKEANIVMTDEEIKKLDDYIKTQIIDTLGEGNKIKANKEFKKRYGFTIDVMREVQIQSYIVQKYQAQEIAAIPDEDADVEKYYNSNIEWYKEDTQFRKGAEEAVWARHILIKVDKDASQEEKKAAEKKAKDLIAELKAGKDFAELAKKYSDDDGSKDRGGDYLFGKDSMYKEFEEAAFSLKPGQLTETPVLTEAGYHIIKLEEKYAKGEPVSLKCAQEYYEYGKEFVKYKIYQQKVADWVKNASFEINKDVYDSIKLNKDVNA